MGKITILPETTKNPITLIGERAGICFGADITDDLKNLKRIQIGNLTLGDLKLGKYRFLSLEEISNI